MANTDLKGVIQEIVQECITAMKPADLVTGTVLSVSPLSVQPDASMPPIPKAALLLTTTVIGKIEHVQGGAGGTVEINPGLKAGDKVIMLRVSKGQRYLILSTISTGV